MNRLSTLLRATLIVAILAITSSAFAQKAAYASLFQTPDILKIDAATGLSGEKVADMGDYVSVCGTAAEGKYYMQVNDKNGDSFWGYYDFGQNAFVMLNEISFSDELRDLTYDPVNKRILGCKGQYIYTVDMATGAKTQLYKDASAMVMFAGVAVSNAGFIYAVRGGTTNKLYMFATDGTMISNDDLTLPEGYKSIDAYSSLAFNGDELYYSMKCKTPDSGTGYYVMLAKVDTKANTISLVGEPIAEDKSRTALSFADFGTGGGTGTVEPDKAVRVKSEYTYGDAMGGSSTPTKQTDYFYGPKDQLLRAINYQASNGNLDPYTYTKYVYTDKEDGSYSVYSIQRKKIAGGGSLSDTDRYWQAYLASTAEENIYSADGKLAKQLTGTYNTAYVYDGDNLVEENQTYSDNASATLAGTAYKRIIYSDFVEGLTNCPAKSITAAKTASSVYWTEYEYDANGNRVAATIFKTTGAVQGDDGLYMEGAEKGVEYHKDVWTYDDQNRLTEHIYYASWDATNKVWKASMSNKRDSLGYEGNAMIKQSYTGDPVGKDIDKWMKSSTYTKTVTSEYNGAVALANFAVTEDTETAGNYILTADAPEVNMNKTYKIYRDAAYIGDMTPDAESGKMTFTDKGIVNGVHDWFVQTFDDATNEGLSISDAVEVVVAKDLAPAADITIAQNELVGDKYQIKVTWTKPETDGATVQGYNFYANVPVINGVPNIAKATPQNTAPITTTSYSFQWSIDGIGQANKTQSFWIETIYDLGKVKSDEQKVTLNVMEEASSIAEVKTLEDGTTVKLNLTDAVVTVMENMGMRSMYIIEDASGAMMVDQSIVDKLPNAFTGRGVSITGSIFCDFINSFGMVGIQANNYTSASYIDYGSNEDADKLIPGEVTPTTMTVKDAMTEANMFRYVKFENCQLTVSDDGYTYYVEQDGEKIQVMDMFQKLQRDEEYHIIGLGNQNFVNGIVYFDGETYSIVPTELEKGEDVVFQEVSSIAEAKALEDGTAVKLNLTDAKVTVMEDMGMRQMNIIEDATGAMMVDQSIVEALPNAFTGRGVSITGSIVCDFINSFGMVGIQANDYTSTSVIDYGEGEALVPGEVTPTTMTVKDAMAEANMFRYVKFENCQLTVSDDGYTYYVEQDGEKMQVMDMFQKLQRDEDYNIIGLGKQNFVNGIVYFDGETYSIVPTELEKGKDLVYKEIAETTVFLPTEENVAAAKEEGWAVGGDTRMDNKKGDIDPSTGETISAKTMPGVGLKMGNASKTFGVYVTGIDKVIGYGVSGSTTERSLRLTATPTEGEAVMAEQASTGNSVAVEIELDRTQKYFIDFTGVQEGAGGDVALHGVKFVVESNEPQPVEETRVWDFTSWSEETKANLAAEAAEVEIGAAETLWRSYEKVAGPSDVDPDRGGACYWYGTAISQPTEMTANGTVIAEMAGLQLNSTGAGVPAIAIDYPETSIGTYAGPSYLWLNGKNASFIIPSVKPGYKIVMDVESHKSTEARGVKLSVNGTEIGQGVPTAKESFSWIVPEDVAETAAVDVLVTTTSGCHIYCIKVGADVETGITGVNTVEYLNGNVYNMNGTIVRTAGQTMEGLAKGIYIVGGKKVVVK